jgi:hypothetical protein
MNSSLRHTFFAAVLALSGGLAWADEGQIEFEDGDTQWKGWNATMNAPGEKSQYRLLPNWETPFSFTYDNDKPKDGSSCLKWEFNAEVPGLVSLRTPRMPISGKEVSISFWVRTKGMEKGLFCFDETAAAGQRAKAHWAAAKITGSDDWTEVTWQGPLDPGTAALQFSFVFSAVPAGSCIWIDHLTVKSTP